MSDTLRTGHVHHLRFTVTDVPRAREFYSRVFGLELVVELGAGVLLGNGNVMIGLGPAPDASRAPANDRFDENRVGLDHLSLSVGSADDLERAVRILDELGAPHGEITDLGEGFGIKILAFRDPDNIQLELTSPR